MQGNRQEDHGTDAPSTQNFQTNKQTDRTEPQIHHGRTQLKEASLRNAHRNG